MKRYSMFLAPIAVVLLVLVLTILPASAAPQHSDQPIGDPIGNYNFRVEIDGVAAGYFTAVDGLSIEQEVIEYQNGDDPLTHKRPGRVKYGEITLTTEYTSESILNDWIEAARFGNGEYTRKNMSVVLTDQSGQEIKRWNFFECFPKSWKLSSLDSKGNDVLTEEIVIIVEWFEEA
ncbi:phage tail protein [Chloroflexota bacterium]